MESSFWRQPTATDWRWVFVCAHKLLCTTMETKKSVTTWHYRFRTADTVQVLADTIHERGAGGWRLGIGKYRKGQKGKVVVAILKQPNVQLQDKVEHRPRQRSRPK